jgi:alpha-tubulin suppressor-like RCC1 family protein
MKSLRRLFLIVSMASLILISGVAKVQAFPAGVSPDGFTPNDHIQASAISVSAGSGHTCAVKSNGGVLCWGNNQYGQLGDGTTETSNTPVEVVGLSSGVVAVSAGGFHTCALTTIGAVKCWGNNLSLQLGLDPPTTYSSVPVAIATLESGVIDLSSGMYHICALTNNGAVKCWGDNGYGQIGVWAFDGGEFPPYTVNLSEAAVAISTGADHTCALTATGGVKCWGRNNFGQLGHGGNSNTHVPTDVTGLTSGVTGLGEGFHHTCATVSGGTWCWGRNWYGELGDGTTKNSSLPVEVGGLSGEVQQISSGGGNFSCALENGVVKCWGKNDVGQLGNGTTENSLTPLLVTDLQDGVRALDTGSIHSCAITLGGGIKCWGFNEVGQLGDDSNENRLSPVDVVGFEGLTLSYVFLPMIIH